MLRQYQIITKTPETEPVALEPTVHAALYNVPEVRAAVEFARTNPNAEMVAMRIDARFYSVVVSHAEELKLLHFPFEDTDA